MTVETGTEIVGADRLCLVSAKSYRHLDKQTRPGQREEAIFHSSNASEDATKAGKQSNLAHRLFQLAADTDRVGLPGQAQVLAALAASILDGRPVVVRDA